VFRCYEVTISKLVVQVGPDGTNEDVTAKVSKGHFVTFFSNSWYVKKEKLPQV
jgi:hypothetical protein